ncbi:zinc ribbon domain-containing protein [Streptomyces sp. NPDC059909]|uniref:zinc ribbon domain-containing protein n=1 Tax=Streptomyces sp. NPDC059909 TaxID=3346998 RepID=UPI003664B317
MFCEYKATRRGRKFVKVARDFPSSQICSDCGFRDGPKPLHIREWTCDNCNTRHDRDWNAGRNIKYEGRRMLAATAPSTPGPGARRPVTATVNACGAHVRPGNSPAARTTPTLVGRKQEPTRSG